MNMDKTTKILYPESFKTQYIRVYYSVNDELRNLIEESGYKNEFTRKYRKSLIFLEDLKENCTKQKLFEKLTEAKGLYSIRLSGEKNIRILFTFSKSDSQRSIAVLLYAFQEKDHKNKSKTSYNHAIKIAQERILELRNKGIR